MLVRPAYTNPVQAIVKASTRKTRRAEPRSAAGCGARSDLASETRPPRHAARSAIPVAMASTPGTMKAARHETKSIIAPTNTGAAELPTFPKTPLMPSAMPRFRAAATIQAMPTGW